MSEKMPQSEVDRRFWEIFSLGIVTHATDDTPTLNDHYEHLKQQGYNNREIEEVFDIVMQEGKAYEV